MGTVANIGPAQMLRSLRAELGRAQHRVDVERWVLDSACPPNDPAAVRARLSEADERVDRLTEQIEAATA